MRIANSKIATMLAVLRHVSAPRAEQEGSRRLSATNLGCYNDNSERVLSAASTQANDMDPTVRNLRHPWAFIAEKFVSSLTS